MHQWWAAAENKIQQRHEKIAKAGISGRRRTPCEKNVGHAGKALLLLEKYFIVIKKD